MTTYFPPFNFGGDGVFVRRQADALVRRGHHVEVVHCIDSFEASGRQPATPDVTEHSPRYPVHSIRSGWGTLSPLATHLTGLPLFKWGRLRAILESGRFDVIHFHNVSLIGGPGILNIGNSLKLFTMHDHWLLCPSHVMFRNNRRVCTVRTCTSCQLMHRRPPQLWRHTGLLRRAAARVDAFLAQTRFTRDIHASEFPELPWFVVPPACPPCGGDAGVPLTPASPSDRPYFLYVGRLERLKGPLTLLPLFARTAQGPPPADLVIAGAGSQADELSTRLALGDGHVHWMGELSHARLVELYRRAVAVIVPSQTYEVFPQVVMEAFAVSTPVLVRDIGPLPEIVSDSRGGLVYRTDEELRRIMLRLVLDRGYRDRLGKAGHRMTETAWSEESSISRYLEVIDGLQVSRLSQA